MFYTSTKVAVLASSNIKGIGPKHGSIGYAVVDGGIFYNSYPLSSGITDEMILSPTNVMFTRYGFGKERSEHEYKSLLNVFPIMNKAVKIEDMEQAVSKTIAKFRKENFENGFWLDSKMDAVGRTNANVCIMAPVLTLGTDLRTCSNLEFTAWFYSMLSTYSVKTTIARINHGQYLEKLPSEESRATAVSLRRCISDGKNKLDYLKKIIDSPETRAPVIELLKLMYSIARATSEEHIRKQTQSGFESGVYRYSKGKTVANSNFFRAVMYDIFSDHAFETRKQMVSKGTESTIVSRIGHTKRIFKLMAHEIAWRI